jgi:RimJ/RimL family protein N-acetyltransferase
MPDHPPGGQQLLAALKSTAKYGHASLALPVGQPVKALIRPIATVAGHLDPEDVRLLTEWRNRHVKSFLTEFVANDERTSQWLMTSVHANPSKMLFMVESLTGERFGHIGLGFIDWAAGYGEADAIVSGGRSPKGLMKESLQALLRWARDVLGLGKLAVRVRSDNSAVDFYRKVGFVEYQRVPLVAEKTADGINWYESPQAKDHVASLVYMQLELEGSV